MHMRFAVFVCSFLLTLVPAGLAFGGGQKIVDVAGTDYSLDLSDADSDEMDMLDGDDLGGKCGDLVDLDEDDDVSPEAAAFFKAGVAHYNAERYPKAIDSFTEAHDLAPSWKILYDIGQAQVAQKNYPPAVSAYQAALLDGRDTMPTAWRDVVTEKLDRLRNKVGFIQVRRGAARNIEVVIDEHTRGYTRLRAPIPVTADEPHTVLLIHDDKLLVERDLTVDGGEIFVMQVPKNYEDDLPMVRAGTGERDGLPPAAFWTSLGITAAFGITSLVFEGVIGRKLDDVRADPNNQSRRDTATNMQTANYIFIGFTAAGVVTTCILAAFTDWNYEQEAQDNDLLLKPWSAGNGGGLVLEGSF